MATAPRADAGLVDVDAATEGLQLRVRLRGLHAKAPWTALYELMCDFRDHGAHRQRFTGRPREVTEVRIRLP